MQILRTDNLHTSAALGLHERWRYWLLRSDEGIWGLGATSLTLRDRETWRVQDRLGLPLVQEAVDFTYVEPDPFATGGAADATFFISDPGANRVVSIARDGGNQQVYAAGYAPDQIVSHHYTSANGQKKSLVLIAAEDGLYVLDPHNATLKQQSGNWRISDIVGDDGRVFWRCNI